MTAVAIRVDGLGKRYRVGARGGRYKTLREAIVNAVNAPFRWNGRAQREEERYIWALKDVSFEVKEGEVVGIIGLNGAGKSTLLKILSQITDPTEGHAEVRGRVRSLLEVGTGFHPELTGRENVYVNGAILGMTKREVDRKFDAIVEFAGVERFIDTPVKYYSSGMQVRLAFAVAAHLEPEILLVDEVLAVGDAEFQKKCLAAMGEVSRGGRTVLFVSHNMGAIRRLCSRGIWLHLGRVVIDGSVDCAISSYMDSISQKGFEIQAGDSKPDDQLMIKRVILRNSAGEMSTEFSPGAPLTVEIHYYAPRRFERPHFWVGIVGQYGPLFGASMLFDGHCPEYVEGEGVLSCTFGSLPLVPQTYTVRMGVRARDGITLLTRTREVGFFNIVGWMKDYGFLGELADAMARDSTSMILPYKWRLPDGRVIQVDGFSGGG
jgi:lipopolysaccharide transport system ATP-binding protein